MPFAPSRSRASRAIESAASTLLRLISEIIAGSSWPASLIRPTRSASSWALLISVSMKTSFSWVICFLASWPPCTSRAPLLDQESAHAVLGGRPDDRHVGERAVGDPALGARDHPAAAAAHRARAHRADVAARIGLGEAEAADRAPRGQLGQPALLLRVGAVAVDRVHHQRALHRRARAHTRAAALQPLHPEPVGAPV